MAEEIKKDESVTVNNDNKTTGIEKQTTVAPTKEKTMEGEGGPGKEDFNNVLEILNMMDSEVGGKGKITEIPEDLKASIKYLVDKLIVVRDAFADPMWKSLLDDMADQAEDGKTPSVEVAIARTVPMEKLQELADNEEYEGAQSELADNLAAKQKTEDEDAMYDQNFQKTQEAANAYAEKMGYDETRKNVLLQKVFDLYKVMADGILTEHEFSEVDKMLNYDTDTADLRSQIESGKSEKEVLPDQSSVDATIKASQEKPVKKSNSVPGLGSMNMETPAFINTGKKRFQK